ncbi:hypothetical protein AAFF_G00222200 [Aldrovandia affinis]|uniref:Uncharacterized protein n=1 Tax=Aldrovandia affinis TaxID=143900 RepID=A0AAD7RFL1_9TELE|nr:hypothetical protein AAFF_G00222200 [Aldrovandia affinis]
MALSAHPLTTRRARPAGLLLAQEVLGRSPQAPGDMPIPDTGQVSPRPRPETCVVSCSLAQMPLGFTFTHAAACNARPHLSREMVACPRRATLTRALANVTRFPFGREVARCHCVGAGRARNTVLRPPLSPLRWPAVSADGRINGHAAGGPGTLNSLQRAAGP